MPAATVTSQPNKYPFLHNIPGGLSITGSDGLIYTFDDSMQNWIILPIVENNVRTPCLYDKVENLRNADLKSKIRDIFDRVFDNDDTPNSFVFTEAPSFDKPATTELIRQIPLQVQTTLNTSILKNASNEYVTIAIFHEIMHGVLYYQGKADSLHHAAILDSYIGELVQVGQSFFPNTSLKDIRGIALVGLGEEVSNSQAYQDLLTQFGLTKAEVSSIGLSYRRDNVAGNEKKGTPCQ